MEKEKSRARVEMKRERLERRRVMSELREMLLRRTRHPALACASPVLKKNDNHDGRSTNLLTILYTYNNNLIPF